MLMQRKCHDLLVNKKHKKQTASVIPVMKNASGMQNTASYATC